MAALCARECIKVQKRMERRSEWKQIQYIAVAVNSVVLMVVAIDSNGWWLSH
jgi:hypothetical protein